MHIVIALALVVLANTVSMANSLGGRQALSLTIKQILGATFRLDRVLSNRGVVSRANVEGLLRQGNVLVDGEVARRIGHKVAYGASITVDGQPVSEVRASSPCQEAGRGEME